MGYFFPSGGVAGATPCRASQVPRPICQHAPSPITPESPTAAYVRCFTAGTGLHLSWTDGHSHKYNEAEMDSLALRLAPSPHEASPDRVTPSRARSATCQTDNLQGELLSVHKIGQASPGAPGLTGLFFIILDTIDRIFYNIFFYFFILLIPYILSGFNLYFQECLFA